MKMGFLVIINDFGIDHDPRWVTDKIQEHLESLGFQHVDVEMRSVHHVDNT